ncbi:MAG: hypothetical protein ACC663_10135, partial [Gammaproteobacteria bacterium]
MQQPDEKLVSKQVVEQLSQRSDYKGLVQLAGHLALCRGSGECERSEDGDAIELVVLEEERGRGLGESAL